MKLKYLFFCMISFAYAHTEVIASKKITLEHRVLAENIFNLLSSGHSIDDVINFLNNSQESPNNNQKLIPELKNLLHKQYSKNDLINIVVNNQETEKFYAWKNFKSKLDTCAILAGAITILYLLYKYCDKDDGGILPYYDKKPQSPKRLMTQTTKRAPQARHKNLDKKKSRSNRGWPLRFRKVSTIDHELEEAIEQQFEYARGRGRF